MLEEENDQLKIDLKSAGITDVGFTSQVKSLEEKISMLETRNVTLKNEETRLVAEIKNYKRKSFIGVRFQINYAS
jgi:cell division protein FtsB